MKTKFTAEHLEKAMQAKTVEDLIELAKGFGVELTHAEATAYFAQLNPTSEVLSDAELERVSSGCDFRCPYVHNRCFLNRVTSTANASMQRFVPAAAMQVL